MKIANLKKEEDALVMDFYTLDSWDDFEHIISLLEQYFKAKVIERVDGPESKFVVVIIDKCEMTLINNPYGNTLKAFNINAFKVLQEIYDRWSEFVNL
ncbi:hypothetical protein GCM10027037_24310 [Mucilaginibacter koreensis]